MRSLKSLSVCLLISLSCIVASAQTKAVTDSVSDAFATVWAEYLRQELPSDSVAASKFLEGLNETFKTDDPMIQYCRGVLVGLSVSERIESMKTMGMPVSDERTFEILTAFLSGKKSPEMSVEEANEYLNGYVAGLMNQGSKLSLAEEQSFIDEVAKKDGANILPSGVVIVTIAEGVGESPSVGDEVMVSYEGRLSDGTVFDSTESPISMTVGTLVPGFNQGLLKMKPGGTYRLVIPAEMGYGSDGIPGVIPGNAALDFTITLQ